MPNSAPTGTRLTITIPRSDTLRQNGFRYGGDDGDAFQAAIVATLPGSGTLCGDSNGALDGGRTAAVAGRTILARQPTVRGP